MQEIKTKINIKLILFITIIIIFSIVVIVFIMSLNKKEEPLPQEPPKSTNIKITDELMKELDRKVKLLKYKDFCDITGTTAQYPYDCLYRKEITTKDDLSEIYKLYTLILSVDENMESKINYVVGNIIVEDITFRYTQQLTLKEYENEYSNLYGDPSNLKYEQLNSLKRFPYIRYDINRNRIYYQTEGEPHVISTSEIIEYVYDYETDEQNAYVYVATAFIAPNGKGGFSVYADYNKTNELNSLNTMSYDKKEIITRDNFKQFNTYKYTFTKDESSGKLLFNQVELIK